MRCPWCHMAAPLTVWAELFRGKSSVCCPRCQGPARYRGRGVWAGPAFLLSICLSAVSFSELPAIDIDERAWFRAMLMAVGFWLVGGFDHELVPVLQASEGGEE